MNILNTERSKKYFEKRPIVEIYKGYEIRKYKDMFLVDAAIAIYGIISTHIKDCYEFIDKFVSLGISQYDDESVTKYILHNR